MLGLDNLETLFVVTALLFHLVLITHFALRKWRFSTMARYGWLTYALGVPAAIVSAILLLGGKTWWMWLGGFLYFVWAIYGYVIDYVKQIQWRVPIRWPTAGPYLFLYLATVMFYWWPVASVYRPMWYVFAALFIISTVLNLTSHHPQDVAPTSPAS